ncbi:MAG: hypothetical protein Q4G30_04125 [Actinomycetaceae bacterium]|nr:hypothetical protein [Actinomycetaceae bacterium]
MPDPASVAEQLKRNTGPDLVDHSEELAAAEELGLEERLALLRDISKDLADILDQ